MSDPTVPEEILFHALQWVDEYRAAKPSQRHLLGYCENAALVIESRAYKALTAEGIRPMDDITGADPDAIRSAWVNEAMHSCDFYPLYSPEHLAFTCVLFAADLREAIEDKDAEMAALSMMGLISTAIQGGYQLQLDLVENLKGKVKPFQQPRQGKPAARSLALDELVKVHGPEITAEDARRILRRENPSVLANIKAENFASALSRAKTRFAKNK